MSLLTMARAKMAQGYSHILAKYINYVKDNYYLILVILPRGKSNLWVGQQGDCQANIHQFISIISFPIKTRKFIFYCFFWLTNQDTCVNLI